MKWEGLREGDELSRMSEELARGEGVCIASQWSMERQVARQVSELVRVVHVSDACHVNMMHVSTVENLDG